MSGSIMANVLLTFSIITTIGIIIGIIALSIWIYRNTGERGAAKRAERDYRYRKAYEIKDEVDKIAEELNAVNAEVSRQHREFKYRQWRKTQPDLNRTAEKEQGGAGT